MNKLQFTRKQFDEFQKLCDQMGVTEKTEAEGTFVSSVRNAEYSCDDLKEALESFTDSIHSLSLAMYDKDRASVIDSLSKMSQTMTEMQEYITDLQSDVTNTVANIKKLTCCSPLKILSTPNEILEFINKSQNCDIIDLNYKDSEFKLTLYRAHGNEPVPTESLLIATGTKQDYDEVLEYVEQFIETDY